MNGYRFILFLHIASAVLLIGGSVAGILVRSAVRRCSTTREVAAVLALGRPLSIMNPLSAFALLGTGIYLASMGRWWTTPWVLTAVLTWVINVVVAKGVVGRVVQCLTEHVGRVGEEPVTHDVDIVRRSAAWTVGGDLLVANDLAILFLMTFRSSLVESLATVAVAGGVPLGLTWLRVAQRRLGAARAARAVP